MRGSEETKGRQASPAHSSARLVVCRALKRVQQSPCPVSVAPSARERVNRDVTARGGERGGQFGSLERLCGSAMLTECPGDPRESVSALRRAAERVVARDPFARSRLSNLSLCRTLTTAHTRAGGLMMRSS